MVIFYSAVDWELKRTPKREIFLTHNVWLGGDYMPFEKTVSVPRGAKSCCFENIVLAFSPHKKVYQKHVGNKDRGSVHLGTLSSRLQKVLVLWPCSNVGAVMQAAACPSRLRGWWDLCREASWGTAFPACPCTAGLLWSSPHILEGGAPQ